MSLDAKIGSLKDIAGGRVEKDLVEAVEDVVKNMKDQEFPSDAPRKIVMTLVFKPCAKRRDTQAVEIIDSVETKFPKRNANKAVAYLSTKVGNNNIFTNDPDQMSLIDQLNNTLPTEPEAKPVQPEQNNNQGAA